ncbi:MAG: manganese efflux pump MntP family protein [Oscillospiraceae bacterium]|jgi:putative Mn2+ efflux pump MntP|nr:manganese efflux pump MntP family protein [Oscillospiraceae bacterium]
MSIIELFLIALALSMDAFAVSVTNGLSYKPNLKYTVGTALCFGVFQGAMPTLGYFLGSTFSEYVEKFDHWLAFILLGFIGGKMLYEALKSNEESKITKLTPQLILVQGLATSIDALAVGVSFATLSVNIVTSALFITITTFICSFIGVIIGKKSGNILGNKAEIFGGIILIAIGTKILIQHIF